MLFTALLCILSSSELSWTNDLSLLTALNDSTHALQLYRELHTEDAPSEEDPSTSNAPLRKRLCEEITNSQFFRRKNLLPIDPKRSFLHQPRSTRLFRQLYTPTAVNFFEYTNAYELRTFKVADHGPLIREHVIACTLFDLLTDDFVPLYVSKRYNVSPFHHLYMPGRFLIASHSRISYDNDVVLAETPARAYTRPDFNVELHYLRMRKYVVPAPSNAIDPFCRLVSGEGHDPRNQHYRICVAVFRSTYFAHKVTYPQPGYSTCSSRKVSFRTAEGVKEAAKNVYVERMTLCYTTFHDLRRGFSSLYISRAYGSNRLLVYRQDPSGANVYLENLSTNVTVVDELNSFDFVEY